MRIVTSDIQCAGLLSRRRAPRLAALVPGCRTARSRWRSQGTYKPLESIAKADTTFRPSHNLPGKYHKRLNLRTGDPSAAHLNDTNDTDTTVSANFDKEKFYRFYLRPRPVKRSTVDAPGAWVTSLDVDAIKATLPLPLRERPLDFFSESSRDLITAQRCLEIYIAESSKECSMQDLKKELAKSRPGTNALSWLLRDYDQADLRNNPGFLKALIHCLVAESNERHIWHWLAIPHTPSVLAPQAVDDRHSWRSAVLRFLVESQAHFAEGGCIDESLRTFEHGCKWKI